MKLRGYRDDDRALLTGDWLPGELLGRTPAVRPALAERTGISADQDRRAEVYVIDGIGVVRFAELDWVHRRARIETGLLPTSGGGAGTVLLRALLAHAFDVLNLHRVYGWITPETGADDSSALLAAGFRREAEVPAAGWLAGRLVPRELWAAMRHG